MPRACGSWRGSVRLSTRTRSPPTAATRSRRSVVVAATESVAATSTAAITTRRFASPLGEDRFRDHAVHALANVDDLRDAAVADHRRQRVGLVATEGHHLLAGEEVHRLARGDLHRLVEVLVETGGDGAGERLQIDHDAGLELRLLLLPVEVVVADEALREFRRELADGREL